MARKRILDSAPTGFIGSVFKANEFKNALKIRRQKIREALGTKHQRNALEEISISTHQAITTAIKLKQETVLEINSKKLLDQEILKQGVTVYAGSSVEFAYPLALGARHILMVDPIFAEENYIDDLKEEVEEVVSKIIEIKNGKSKPVFDGNVIKFKYRHNKKLPAEEVTIELVGAYYASPAAYRKIDADAPRFETDENIAMLLAHRFKRNSLLSDVDSVSKLIPGGYVLIDDTEEIPDELVREWFFNKAKLRLESFEKDNRRYAFLRRNRRKRSPKA